MKQVPVFKLPVSNDYQAMRHINSVWTVATQPFKGSHFATFPPELIRPCILAGSRPAGKRCDCDEIINTPLGTGEIVDPSMETGRAGLNRPRRPDEGVRPVTRRQQRHWAIQLKSTPHRFRWEKEVGLEAYAHYLRTDASGARPPRPDLLKEGLREGWLTEPTPCDCPIEPADTVLDPFGGSGTVGQVCKEQARNYILIELNSDYVPLIQRRLAGAALNFEQQELV